MPSFLKLTGNPLWWQRLRHGRGFGVHSPFAFRFILEVLNERLPYYAYDTIGREVARQADAGDLRLFFRLLVCFRPPAVAVISRSAVRAAEFRRVAEMASSRITVSDTLSKGCFALFDGVLPPECTDGAPEGGNAAHAPLSALVLCDGFRPADVAERYAAAAFGMSFANRARRFVYAALPHLPRQHFNVRY